MLATPAEGESSVSEYPVSVGRANHSAHCLYKLCLCVHDACTLRLFNNGSKLIYFSRLLGEKGREGDLRDEEPCSSFSPCYAI